MNKIYQVIWSKTKHMYIVVSELAHHDGKAKTTVHKGGTAFSKVTAALVLAALLNAAPVYAEDKTVDIGNGGTATYTEQGDVVIGKDNQLPDDKSGQKNVVTGTGNSAKHEDGEGKPQQFVGDNQTLITETENADGSSTITANPVDGTKTKGLDSAVISGNGAVAQADGDTSVGKGANITNPLVPYYADANGKATPDPAQADYFTNPDGQLVHTKDLVYTNGQTDPDTGKPVETTDPYYKHTYETTVTIVHPDGTVEERPATTSTAIDQNSRRAGKPSYDTVKDDKGNIITTKTKEISDPVRNLADGYAYYSKDMYDPSTDSIAAGTNASVIGQDAVAAGHDAKASDDAVAVGHKASAEPGAVAVGTGASADINGVAAGINATAAENGVASGNGATAGEHGVASGDGSYASDNSQAVGSSAQATNESTAVGNGSRADWNSIAVGNNSSATGNGSAALGNNTSVTVDGGVALGEGSKADRGAENYGWDPVTKTQATADDKGTDPVWYSNRGAVSVGASDANGNVIESRQITNVAAGTNDSDAVNVAQLKSAVTAAETHYYSWNDQDDHQPNYKNDGATGNRALAAGIGAAAAGDGATSVGNYTNASGKTSIAIGGTALDADGNMKYEQVPKMVQKVDDNGQPVTDDEGNPVMVQATDDEGNLLTENKLDANGNPIPLNTEATGENAIAVGTNAKGWGQDSIAIGTDSKASATDATAVGRKSNAWAPSASAFGAEAEAGQNATAVGKTSHAYSENATSVGADSNANYSATAVGQHANATSGYDTAVGQNSTASGSYSVAVGQSAMSSAYEATAVGQDAHAVYEHTTALGHSSMATASYATAVGDTAQAKAPQATAVGYTANATSTYTTAVGYAANANANNDTAVGTSSKAYAGNATAVGYSANAVAPGSTSVGQSSNATSYQATAVGYQANANSSGATALGQNAYAYSQQSTAVGYYANASSYEATAVGHAYAPSQYATAVGYQANASGNYSTAVGHAYAPVQYSTAVGEQASAQGYNATSAGYHAYAYNSNSTAFGANSAASNSNNTAIGYYSYAGGSGNSVAVGYSASANADNAVAIGGGRNYSYQDYSSNTSASASNSVAIGSNAKASATNAVAIGSNQNTSYNPSASGYNSVAIGSNAKAASNGAIAIGSSDWYSDSISATGSNSLALGYSAKATDTNAIGIGSYANAYSQNAVRIGASDNTGANAVNRNSVGIGTNTNSWGTNAVRIGYSINGYNNGSGNNSVSIGVNARAGATDTSNAIAMGTGSNAYGNDAIAMSSGASAADFAVSVGKNADAWREDSIVFGYNSKSGAEHGIIGYDPLSANIGQDYTTPTWTSTNNAVSFGRAEERDADGNVTLPQITRQINNVAAGTLDTDVVNVAQLKSAIKSFEYNAGKWHDYDVNVPTEEIMSDTNYDNTGAQKGKRAMAAGFSAQANGDDSMALGHAVANGTESVAIGKGANVIGVRAVGFGANQSIGLSSMAFGQNNTAGTPADENGAYTLQYNGAKNKETVMADAAMHEAYVKDGQTFNVTFKTEDKADQHLLVLKTDKGDPVVLAADGKLYNVTWDGSQYVQGDEATDLTTDDLVTHNYNTDGATFTGAYSTAFGKDNVASGTASLAFGGEAIRLNGPTGNKATGVNAVAFGNSTLASGQDTVAFGDRAKATNDEAVAFGQDTLASAARATAFGESTVASGQVSTAFGNHTIASNTGATALGNKSQATGMYSMAWGGGDRHVTDEQGNELKDDKGNPVKTGPIASGLYSTAFGSGTQATADNATAFGELSNATAKNATAFGKSSEAKGENSLAALGGTAEGANSTAIGVGATAKLDGSIALGDGAVANRESGKEGYDALGTGYVSTNESAAWKSTKNALSVGDVDNKVTRQITGLAAGSEDTDAVNVAQLKRVTTLAEQHTLVTVNQSKTEAPKDAATGKYTDKYDMENGNLNIRAATGEYGQNTFNIKLNDQIGLGQKGEPGTPGKDGVDGKITVTEKDGSQVIIGKDGKDGKNGISIKGADGKDGVSITGPTGEPGKDGNDGHIGIAGKDGKDAVGINGTDGIGTIGLSGKDGKDGISVTTIRTEYITRPGVDGEDGKDGITRIIYKDPDGEDHPVATLDDGMKYGANIAGASTWGNPVANKLNTIVNVKGGADATSGYADLVKDVATDEAKLNAVKTKYSGQNVLTTVEQDAATGTTTIKVLLDKDLQEDTINVGGKDGEPGKDGKDGVDGRIGVQGKNGKDGVTITAKGEDGKDGAVGEIGVKGEDGKDGVTISGKDGIGVNGKDGKDGNNGKDAVSITAKDGKDGVNGKDGHIGMTGTRGIDGKDGTDGKVVYADIQVRNGHNGVDGTDGKPGDPGKDGMTRIVYEDNNTVIHEVATLDDGLKFTGNNSNTTNYNKLNTRVNVVGEGTYKQDATDKTKLYLSDGTTEFKSAANNIAVVANGENNDDSTLTIKLNKDVNLGGEGSLTVGGGDKITREDGTVVDNDPIIIKNYNDGDLIDNKGNTVSGGDYITGLDNRTWNINDPTYVSGRAATEDELKQAGDQIIKNITNTTENGGNGGFGLQDEHTGKVSQDLGTNIQIIGDGKRTYETKTVDGKEVKVIKDVTDSNITTKVVELEDGSKAVKVALSDNVNIGGNNGKDGKISVNGKDGKDGNNGRDAVSISASDGLDGINGKDGHIGMTGTHGVDGRDGRDGTNGKVVGADITVRNGHNGLDGTDGNNGKDGMTRVVYEDNNNVVHEVATLDDGLKFTGNNGETTNTNKLNTRLTVEGEGNYTSKTENGKTTLTYKDASGNDKTFTSAANNIAVVANGGKDNNSKLTIELNKDVNLGGDGSLTVGGDTKNGDAIVIKNQEVTLIDKDGNTTTTTEQGDYITGLDNRTWNIDDPTYVSGRAATEDDLKQAGDQINTKITNITDATKGGGFGLQDEHTGKVSQDLGTNIQVIGDGKRTYKDDGNGGKVIDKVEDSNITTKVVELEDGTKAVKVALSDNVNLGGPGKPGKDGTNGVDGSIGINGADGKSGVGIDGKDGISMQGEAGKNGISIKGDPGVDGQPGKDGISIKGPQGDPGTPGNNGHIGITGKDGKDAVAIDGTDGVGTIGLAGKDGKDGISTTTIRTEYVTKPGVDGEDGKDGITRIIYKDPDGDDHPIATLDDGLKFTGNNSSTINRNKLDTTVHVVGEGTGTDLTNFKSAGGNIAVEANGGSDDASTLTIKLNKDVNLGSDGSLTVGGSGGDSIVIKQYNDGDLKDNKGGDVKGGDYITGLDNRTWNIDDPTYVSGRAATEDELKQAGDQINTKITNITDATKGGGFGLEDEVTGKVSQNLGTNIKVIGDGKRTKNDDDTVTISDSNIITRVVDVEDGTKAVKVMLSDTVNIGGNDGKDGKIGVNGKDGRDGNNGKDAVSISASDGADGINGKDGHIGMTGTRGVDGRNGRDGTDGKVVGADITVRNGHNGVDGTDGNNGKDGMTRVVYEDNNKVVHEVATLDDGLKFTGNNSDTVNHNKLNTTVNVVGEGTGKDLSTFKSAGGNIAVEANGGSDDASTLTIKLNKDVNLGGDGSLTVGGSGGDSIVIKQYNDGDLKDNKGGDVKGGDYITGLDNRTWNIDDPTYVSGRAATEDELKQAGDQINTKITNVENKITNITDADKGGGFGLQDEKTGKVSQDLGTNIQIIGDGTRTYKDEDGKKVIDTVTDSNITTEVVDLPDGTKAVEVALSDNVNLGGKGKDGKDGKDGSIGVNGKNGENGVTITAKGEKGADGKDGAVGDIGVKGLDGKDGVSINGKDGISMQGEAGKNGISIKGDPGDDGQPGKDGISIKGPSGKDGDNGHIGISGKDGKDAVALDGKDGVGHIGLTGPAGKDGKNASADISVKNGSNGVDGTDGKNGKDGMDRITYVDHNEVTHEVATLDDGLNFTGNNTDTTNHHKLNTLVKVQGEGTGKDLSGFKSAAGNIAVEADGNDTLTIKLNKDLAGLNSVTTNVMNSTVVNTTTVNTRVVNAGDTVINNDGVTIKNGPTITKNNVDMNNQQIHNVAPGTKPTDAVNVSQLGESNMTMNNRINKLGSRIDRVGAGAAALAALHPLDFDPDEKLDFAAGMGTYKGSHAAAIGAFYRPNEDTMFSLGGSMGGGENMVNVGVSFKLGQHNHVSVSRVALAKEVLELRKELENVKSYLADQAAGNTLDLSKIQLFPDTPENHWAYDYVATMAGNGVLEGYPDGYFKGNRNMTRYEMAAVLYRMMQNGAKLSARALTEFAPELDRIRVDTITKDGRGVPHIQRVRTVKGRE